MMYTEQQQRVPSTPTAPGIITIVVDNLGDMPLRLSARRHFFEAHPALFFERWKAYGMRLHLPLGQSLRFEPGERREVQLEPLEADIDLGGEV